MPFGTPNTAPTRAVATPRLLRVRNLATGSGGTGLGDSGGPAFWVDTDGSLTLVDVTGHGDPNTLATGIDWRVDLPETLDFFGRVINTLLPALR